jgi:hypothetical protein
MGVSILRRARLERFVPAVDEDYDPIRRMARQAESVVLAQHGGLFFSLAHL